MSAPGQYLHLIETIADNILAGGDPRSCEYRQGLIYILKIRHARHCKMPEPRQPSPYPSATAQSDAYHAGCERGHWEWVNNKRYIHLLKHIRYHAEAA